MNYRREEQQEEDAEHGARNVQWKASGQNNIGSFSGPEVTRKDGEKHLTDVGNNRNEIQSLCMAYHGISRVSLFDRSIMCFRLSYYSCIDRITTRIRAQPC